VLITQADLSRVLAGGNTAPEPVAVDSEPDA
jgi:hypothetical protein